MNARMWLLLAAAIVLWAPAATAQALTITLERGDGHPSDHVSVIDESRRLSIPVLVGGTAQGFVCPQNVRVDVEVLLLPYDDQWAGASMNPATAYFDIPAGGPGPDAATYEGTGEVLLELFWGEDRPSTGAQETYRMESSTRWEPTCVPSPGPVHEGSLELSARMDDVAPDANATDELGSAAALGGDCAEAPDLPECQVEVATPDADSPMLSPLLVGVLLAALVALVRRRRA